MAGKFAPHASWPAEAEATRKQAMQALRESEARFSALFETSPVGMALGLQGAMVVEIFPLRTRVTSMSFAYSITLALAGGIAPLVSTWLSDTEGHPLWPAFYVMIYGVIGLAIMLPMRETNHRELSE